MRANKKIAIVGTAPSSVMLVPMADPQWSIWACSPGCAVYLPTQPGYRVDEWYEPHRWGPREDWITAHFREFMRQFKGPVWVNPDHADQLVATGEIPTAVALPVDELIRHFGRRFWCSTPSYMIASAILQEPEEIGLFGIDMSATDEYGYQRASMHHFIDMAETRGIKITVPPESDLLYPPQMYAIHETDPVLIKWLARQREVQGRFNDAAVREQNARDEKHYLRGAVDNLAYMRANAWYYRNTHTPAPV
jgi:hypothetical protein